MKKQEKIFFLLVLVFLAVISRLIPHAPNFTPIAAISIWIFVYFSKKFFWLPALILLISDFWVGFYDWKLMLTVYFSFILVGFLGLFLRKNKSVWRVAGIAILGSIIFFITTNLAVWAFSPWYAKTFWGLIDCYLRALPFLRNSLGGDIFYLSIFVLVSEKMTEYSKFYLTKNKKRVII